MRYIGNRVFPVMRHREVNTLHYKRISSNYVVTVKLGTLCEGNVSQPIARLLIQLELHTDQIAVIVATTGSCKNYCHMNGRPSYIADVNVEVRAPPAGWLFASALYLGLRFRQASFERGARDGSTLRRWPTL